MPPPVPALFTVNVYCVGSNAKVAVTVFAAFIVTIHEPVPVHAPLQPINFDPVDGAADNVTTVPALYGLEQSAPHEIPAGALVTVPAPVPVFVTVKAYCGVIVLKFAVTVIFAFMLTTQAFVPVQPPPVQPVKVEPAAAAAVNVTLVSVR